MALTITLGELRKIIAEELATAVGNKIPGGLADKASIDDVAAKHNVTKEKVIEQLKKGIVVEKEHTNDIRIAAEIALDHLMEDCYYYDKLAGIEKQ